MAWAIVTAVVGALAVAAGAALQERRAITVPTGQVGQLRLLRHLAADPYWVLGTVLNVSGVAAHMWSLSHAPLTVVQPIGVSGLLFAVALSAFLRRRRLTWSQIGGCLAVTAGLIMLLLVLPAHVPGPAPHPDTPVLMPLLALAAMLACVGVARLGGGVTQAWALGVAGGIAYGVTSALARVIGVDALDDPASLMRPLTVVAVAIGLFGAVIVQNSYRTGHFALAYATLLISDPVAAVTIGVVFLGEALPATPVGGAAALVAAALICGGTIALARSSPPVAAQRAVTGGCGEAVPAVTRRREPGPVAGPAPETR
ncbi:hypothetical protein SAMN02745673_04903 [Marinactinospora thermotolerans DSM 45154]|uniref:Magnesium transporter NIPA n=1 Tax=Marinactinospora thermotolerans DSM 45154 TaxID=1122192 RepID=A0A1T4TF76_9ACTN|nr:DMT family transporter [Marinactinospora thermotolerans]SKA38971.1 hypothetical protein SAMN02745673_04903 [Marinactinospora thermotolerans DSM 45154]